MKKISKILLPIASTVAVVAPVTTLASCAKADFVCYKGTTSGNELSSDQIDVESNKEYTVSVSLKNLDGNAFKGFRLAAVSSDGQKESPINISADSKVKIDSEEYRGITIESGVIVDIITPFNKIEFIVKFEVSAPGVRLIFNTTKVS